MSILVYHYGGLGDFLTVLPLLHNLKKSQSSVRVVQCKRTASVQPGNITLLGKPYQGILAEHAGLVERTLDADSSLFLPLFKENCPQKQIEKLLEGFNSILVFSSKDSELFNNIVKHSSIAGVYQNPFPPIRKHIIDYHLSLLETDASSKCDNFVINIPEYLKNSVTHYFSSNKRTVVLSPGSGSSRKSWPFENFLELKKILNKKGITTIWITGPAEQNLKCPESDVVISNMDLPHLAALLSLCDIYIGNDSGTTHLAAICGSAVIAIFGPSDPEIWSPRGKKVHILYKSPPCGPCHPGKPKINCDHSCLQSVSPKEAADKAESIIN